MSRARLIDGDDRQFQTLRELLGMLDPKWELTSLTSNQFGGGADCADVAFFSLPTVDTQSLETLRDLCAASDAEPIVALTEGLNPAGVRATLEAGAFDCLASDSLNLAQLEATTCRALRTASLQAAWRRDQLLLRTLCHEIRTPLNTMLGMTELLLNTPVTKDQCEHLSTILASGETLISAVKNVCDYRDIDTGDVELVEVRFGFGELMRELADAFSNRGRPGLELSVHVSPQVPESLTGDADRLRQIMTHLMNEAAAASTSGEVVVRVEPDELQKDQVLLHFRIAPVGFERLPEPPAWASATALQPRGARVPSAKGLAPVIASRLVELLNGSFWLEGEPDYGNTCHVTLPFRTAPGAESLARKKDSDSSGLRILLAEDSLFNQRLAVALLEKKGHDVQVANNGQEVLELYDRSGFDVIVMDVQMPELDGLMATKEIRNRERKSGLHVPIIAMTAHAMKGDRERCLDAGMDAYLAKPIHASDLYAALANLHLSPGKVAEGEAEPDTVTIDWDAALSRVEGRSELMRELIELFFQEYPQLLADIDQAVRDGDATTLQIYAHRLKGCLRYFGNSRAAEIALALEDFGRTGDIRKASVQREELESAIERLLPAMRRFAAQD